MNERSKGVLLIVADEPIKHVGLQIELSEAGYTVLETPEAGAAVQQVKSRAVDVVLANLGTPEMDGLRLLEEVKAASPGTHVILIAACASVDSAVEVMKRGAADYLLDPIQTGLLLEKLAWLRSSRQWLSGLDGHPGPERIGSLVGQSYACRQLFEQIRASAADDRPALIQGEDGAGNLEVAKTIHQVSARSGQPLSCLSCAPGSPDDLEVELFAAANAPAGSQSSVRPSVWARLQAAGGGTLLLDEIDGLAPEFQLKLLRLIEQGHEDHLPRAAGADTASDGHRSAPAAMVRFLCASRRNLRALVEAGQFSEDLYYRIGACRVMVPALRDRREDIPLIVEQIIHRAAGANSAGSGPAIHMSPHALEKLVSYHWPGNTRELEHTVELAVRRAAGNAIQPGDIVLEQFRRFPAPPEVKGTLPESAVMPRPEPGRGLTETIAGVERSLIDAALRRAAGNQAKAAQFLGIPRTTLRDKMAKYGMVGGTPAKHPAP